MTKKNIEWSDFLPMMEFTEKFLQDKKILQPSDVPPGFLKNKQSVYDSLADNDRHLWFLGRALPDDKMVILKVRLDKDLPLIHLYGVFDEIIGHEWLEAMKAQYDNCWFKFYPIEWNMTEKGEIIKPGLYIVEGKQELKELAGHPPEYLNEIFDWIDKNTVWRDKSEWSWIISSVNVDGEQSEAVLFYVAPKRSDESFPDRFFDEIKKNIVEIDNIHSGSGIEKLVDYLCKRNKRFVSMLDVTGYWRLKLV